MARTVTAGTLSAIVGTTHDLFSSTAAENFQAIIDLSALADGERVDVAVYTTPLSGGTERLFRSYRATGVLAEPVLTSPIIPSDVQLRITVTQVNGTNRTFPYKIISTAQGRAQTFAANWTLTAVPETGTGPASNARAAGETVTNHRNVAINCRPNEIRFSGANRVENLFLDTGDAGTANWKREFCTAGVSGDFLKLQETTDNNFHILGQEKAISGGKPLMFAIELKAAERSFLRMQIFDATAGANNNVTGTVDLTAGTITISTTGTPTNFGGRMTDLGGGIWYAEMWGTLPAASTSVRARMYPGTNSTTFGYAGTAGSGFLFRKPQLEDLTGQAVNNKANPYVSRGVLAYPYQGAGVDGVKYIDRTNDNIAISGLTGMKITSDVVKFPGSNITNTPMTLRFKWRPDSVGGVKYLLGSQQSADTGIYILHDGTNLIFRVSQAGTLYDATILMNYTAGTEYTIAARAATVAGLDIFVDGTKGQNNGYTGSLAAGTTIELGADGAGGRQATGHYSNASSWAAALSDAELGSNTAAAPTGPKLINPPFPRLMVLGMSNKNYDAAAYQDLIVRYDWSVLGFYPGWKASYAYTASDGVTYKGIEAAVRQLNDKNPNHIIGQYTILNEAPDASNATYAADKDVGTKLDAENWWLRDAAGNRVTWTTAFSTNDINFTDWTAADAQGKRWPQWRAERDFSKYFDPIRLFRLWYCDNVFPANRVVKADPDKDGVDETNTDADWVTKHRAGHVAEWDRIKQLRNDAYIVGNTADSNISMYANQMHGGLLEGFMGESYSRPWPEAMKRYHESMANLLAPKLYGLHVSATATDYRMARFGLCSTLLNDGYHFHGTDYDGGFWFDEYDNAGAGRGYLGFPIEGPQTAAWSSGVYRRRYDKGWALVNPTTAAVTVNLGQSMRKINGTQDATTNNGALVTSVTIPATDGLILLNP